MPFTIDQYNALQDAIAEGALEVKYGDKSVKYDSLQNMIARLNIIGKSLGIGAKKNGGKNLAVFNKGTGKELSPPFFPGFSVNT